MNLLNLYFPIKRNRHLELNAGSHARLGKRQRIERAKPEIMALTVALVAEHPTARELAVAFPRHLQQQIAAVSEHHPLQLEARLNKLIDHVSYRRINIDEPTYVRKIPHVRTSTDEDERYSN
jgi:hypothetical protein